MARPVQGLYGATIVTTPWEIPVFGVRHLSPAGAWHLRRFLDQVRPEVVLVEGLNDATDLTDYWFHKGTIPPIAILAYTADLPVRTLVYPVAEYSPEYQACLWARENSAQLQFIDLPSDIFLGLQDAEIRQLESLAAEQYQESDNDLAEDEPDPAVDRVSTYQQLALLAGEGDYDSFWERNFEHDRGDDSYRLAAMELGSTLRDIESDHSRRHAESLVREAYMRRKIAEYLQQGVDPKRIVAVVGAFHAPVLNGHHPAMSDQELAQLPRRESKLTLMPYSNYRLSNHSGYGAGNSAPAYFQLMWQALTEDDLPSLPARYLSRLARYVRQHGTHRSTAEVIEGVRLAQTLTQLKGGREPTLNDLHDAATTLFGHGQSSSIAEALAFVDVGTEIGQLPEGVSQTSIQEDFQRQLRELKLEKYRTAVKQELQLDLRENRQVKTQAAAFMGLRRSIFFHRLRVLGIPFAKLAPRSQDNATWAEAWELRWTPESEIALVESVLLGETIDLACACKLKQEVEQCTSVETAAQLVQEACLCGMPENMDSARTQLQRLSTDDSAVSEVASAAFQLMQVVRFGDVRQFNTQPLVPLIEAMFVQGCLGLFAAANCDNVAAKALARAMDELNRVSQEFYEHVDEELWKRKLQELADADNRNPLLSGISCALQLERGWMTNDQLAREVSRRLSPGIPADLGAGWFEGLASRNRYALIGRQILWNQLDDYLAELDDAQFKRSLVFLRRAFGSFSPQEKRSIAENLAHLWGVDQQQVEELLDGPLSEKEEEALSDLNDFDFGDI